MNKLIIPTFLMLLINPIFLSANDKSYSFVGVEIAHNSYAHTSSPSFGIKYGRQSDMIRTSINLTHASNSGDNLETLIVQVDRCVLSSLFTNDAIQPYVGFSFGIAQHDGKDKGSLLGLNGGISYILNHSMDINLETRISTASKMNEVSNLNNITLSLHYFY
jgi:hypothetical protein